MTTTTTTTPEALGMADALTTHMSSADANINIPASTTMTASPAAGPVPYSSSLVPPDAPQLRHRRPSSPNLLHILSNMLCCGCIRHHSTSIPISSSASGVVPHESNGGNARRIIPRRRNQAPLVENVRVQIQRSPMGHAIVKTSVENSNNRRRLFAYRRRGSTEGNGGASLPEGNGNDGYYEYEDDVLDQFPVFAPKLKMHEGKFSPVAAIESESATDLLDGSSFTNSSNKAALNSIEKRSTLSSIGGLIVGNDHSRNTAAAALNIEGTLKDNVPMHPSDEGYELDLVMSFFKQALEQLPREMSSRYHFEGLLGYGGNGFVAEARRRETGEDVAIKFIAKSRLSNDSTVASEFYGGAIIPWEAEILRSLNHPNIIRFIELLQSETHFFLVMERAKQLTWVVPGVGANDQSNGDAQSLSQRQQQESEMVDFLSLLENDVAASASHEDTPAAALGLVGADGPNSAIMNSPSRSALSEFSLGAAVLNNSHSRTVSNITNPIPLNLPTLVNEPPSQSATIRTGSRRSAKIRTVNNSQTGTPNPPEGGHHLWTSSLSRRRQRTTAMNVGASEVVPMSPFSLISSEGLATVVGSGEVGTGMIRHHTSAPHTSTPEVLSPGTRSATQPPLTSNSSFFDDHRTLEYVGPASEATLQRNHSPTKSPPFVSRLSVANTPLPPPNQPPLAFPKRPSRDSMKPQLRRPRHSHPSDLYDFLTLYGATNPQVHHHLVTQLLSAYACIRASGHLYLDFRGENVLIDDDLHLTLVDFGMAQRQLSDDADGGSVFVQYGTVEHSAPEILRGEGYRGEEADMWAIGCVVFMVVTGEEAFACEDDARVGRVVFPDGADGRVIEDDCKDFILRLLEMDWRRRATLKDALDHRWIVNGSQQIV